MVLCVFIFSQCNLIQNNVHKNFTYHEEYPYADSLRSAIKLNGKYELQNNTEELIRQIYYLYSDGKVLYSDEYWGHYKVKNDSLHIQYFLLDGATGFYYRNVIEIVGRIKNDSIYIYKYKCDWCNKRYGEGYLNGEIKYNPPRIYTFVRTEIKPDSTKAFYYRKKWYNEGLKKRIRN